jgi:crotonobetainyl-CoA:carnitine CoA-transferase CaiB-like acyl-CoA transferase
MTHETKAETNAPLTGYTVVEYADGVAASYAGRMMSVMGATVIKLEPPGSGSPLRSDEPPVVRDGDASAMFHYLNVGKQFVTCDVASPDGRALLDQLLDRTDLLIDDTSVAQRRELELDPATVGERHESLVYLSVLPFGATGEHAGYRAQELNVFHAGGEGFLMPNGLTLEMFPERPPVKIYGHFAELIGGTSATCAAIAALLAREAAGGQFVDVSVQDANVMVGCFAIQRLGEGVLENRRERSFKYGGVLECADGYVGVLTLEQRQWEGLVKLLDEPAWALDPALADSLERSRRGAAINRHLREWARSQRVDDVVRRGQALSVPIARYNNPSDVLRSEQLNVRRMFQPVRVAAAGDVPVFTAPMRFDGRPLDISHAARSPGADNDAVWRSMLGHDERRLEDWRRCGVI